MNRTVVGACVAVGCLSFSIACDDASHWTAPAATYPGPDGATGMIRIARADPRSVLKDTTAAAVGYGQVPQIVFTVRPAPGADGVIVGTSPFEVEFNVCRSSDPDGDKLLFTMDAEGDGTLDESGTGGGSCRRTFTYTAATDQVRKLAPRVCVVDLDAAGKPQRSAECRTYALKIFGPPVEVRPTSCAAPAPGVTGWLATSTLGSPSCVCSSDGTVIAFEGPYVASCFANGGHAALWGSTQPCLCA
jgi:hypothetical protein